MEVDDVALAASCVDIVPTFAYVLHRDSDSGGYWHRCGARTGSYAACRLRCRSIPMVEVLF